MNDAPNPASFVQRHQFHSDHAPTASTLAYRLADLLRVCVLAEANDSLKLYREDKGLDNTLQLAEHWAAELITEIELLERCQAQGTGV